MKTSRTLLAALVVLALFSPARATPPFSEGRILTQEYARLYREYLDKKQLGLDAEAAAKYDAFLLAFRKHRLLTRLGGAGGGGGNGGGSQGGGDGGVGSGNPGGGNPGGPPGTGGGSDGGGTITHEF